MKPTVGRIVEYVQKDRNGKLQVRPAVIVAVWSDILVNLQVFTDGHNDVEHGNNVIWVTSVYRSEEKKERTWDWMEYQKGQAKKTEELLEVKLSEPVNELTPYGIARICHEVNKAYCQSIGDLSQPKWEDAPQWQKDSAVNGVEFHLNNETTPEQSHENWMKDKVAEGWIYGDVKCPTFKTHPCMVPYNDLPVEQRTKDYLFKAIVDTFK
jgi:hypothetical protein